jgi:hypothetical protein
MVNPGAWGTAIGTPKFQNTGFPIVESGAAGDTVLGYPYLRTNQLPSAGAFAGRVVFADWAQLLVGSWVGFQLVVDPYSLSPRAQVRVTVHQFADMNLRYRRAFCVSTNSGVPVLAGQETSSEEPIPPARNAKK